MAKKSKQSRDTITLECTVCRHRNYTTSKNKKNTTDRIVLNKYCRFDRKHTEHREVR